MKIIIILCILIYNSFGQGVVQQGIDAVGQQLNGLEQKMKQLESQQNSLLDQLDSDLQDSRHFGFHKDMIASRKKIREERKNIRKIEREKRKTLAEMYKKLHTLNLQEQERMVRKLGLMNRLNINHLAILGVNEDMPYYPLDTYYPKIQPGTRPYEIGGNDYLMKDEEDDSFNQIDQQKLKMKELENKISLIRAKYSENPYVIKNLVGQVIIEYNKMLNEMIFKMQKAIEKRQKMNFELRNKLDNKIDSIESNLDLMTPPKREEAIKQINMMKSQRERLNYDGGCFRRNLENLYKKLHRSELVQKKIENGCINMKHIENILDINNELNKPNKPIKSNKPKKIITCRKKKQEEIKVDGIKLNDIEKELIKDNGLLIKIKDKVTKKLIKKNLNKELNKKKPTMNINEYIESLTKFVGKQVVKTARDEITKTHPIRELTFKINNELDKMNNEVEKNKKLDELKYRNRRYYNNNNNEQQMNKVLKQFNKENEINKQNEMNKEVIGLQSLMNEMKVSKDMMEEEVKTALEI